MGIIPQNTNEIQETVSGIFRNIPIIICTDESHLYYLVRDLSGDLEDFILTGKAEAGEFNVFSNERAMLMRWKQAGLSVTHHSQQIEYMFQKKIITYLQIANPLTGMKISLIPWFMLHGRPYPIFTYIYAVWHYCITGRTSQQTSAAAAGRVFGIDKFSKSTLCRNIKYIEQLFDIEQIDKPLSVDEHDIPPAEALIELIPKILGNSLTVELLKELYGEKIKYDPESVRHTENIYRALSGIPHELSDVINASDHVKEKPGDTRKRPARPRNHSARPMRREPEYFNSQQINKTRIAFIAVCRNIVLDAAIKYHRLLI